MDRESLEKKSIKAAMTLNWKEAVLLNKKLLSEGVKTCDVYNRLGKAYGELGNWGKAISSYETALNLDPLSSVAEKGLNNAKMNRRAGIIPSYVHKDSLIQDFSTSHVMDLKLDTSNIETSHEYLLLAGKGDFYILKDKTIEKSVKRISKSKINLKSGVKPNIIDTRILAIEDNYIRLKLHTSEPMFKSDRQQVDPSLDLEHKKIAEEKKEIEKIYNDGGEE